MIEEVRARGRRASRRFPTAPLKDVLEKRASKEAEMTVTGNGARTITGLRGFCKAKGVSDRVLYNPSLTEWTVDRLCCAVGMHPTEVYEDWL